MFTQRHYEKVAEIFKLRRKALALREQWEDGERRYDEGSLSEWINFYNMFKLMFIADNPKFDPDIFARACGLMA
jgi:hypothetical protein